MPLPAQPTSNVGDKADGKTKRKKVKAGTRGDRKGSEGKGSGRDQACDREKADWRRLAKRESFSKQPPSAPRAMREFEIDRWSPYDRLKQSLARFPTQGPVKAVDRTDNIGLNH
jgi:hypothetical protein